MSFPRFINFNAGSVLRPLSVGWPLSTQSHGTGVFVQLTKNQNQKIPQEEPIWKGFRLMNPVRAAAFLSMLRGLSGRPGRSLRKLLEAQLYC